MNCRYQVFVLLALLFLSYLSGGIGGIFIFDSVTGWYAHLKQPPGTPPDWVFSVVWTALYFLFGLGTWLGWRNSQFRLTSIVPVLFLTTLILQTFWTYTFFSLHMKFASLIIVILALLSTVLLTANLARLNRWAAVALIPQNLWLAYATYLSAAIWLINVGHR